MIRRICVVTGSRAEFGLLRWLMEEIKNRSELELQVAVTGMHLSPEFGSTWREVEEAGFDINTKVEMLLSSDSSSSVTKSMGMGLIGFSDAYQLLRPDLVVVLGDRFEIFASVSAALIAGIPVAHLHGGEITEGAFDDAIRHSITKMSHLHFVAAEKYRERVIQLGEEPKRVFNVGGLGIDAIRQVDLLSRDELQRELGFNFCERNLLVTFHPVTLDGATSSLAQMSELLAALDQLENTQLIFTMPNADTGGRELSEMVREFVKRRARSSYFTSLGQRRHYSLLAQVDGVVGNSSSGLTEAPSFKIGTVNIGDRQKGRLRADSVVDCEPTYIEILEAIQSLYSSAFKTNLASVESPYGTGGASKAIAKVLTEHPLTGLLKKSFYDLPTSTSAKPQGQK